MGKSTVWFFLEIQKYFQNILPGVKLQIERNIEIEMYFFSYVFLAILPLKKKR